MAVPFTIPNVHWGLSEASGSLHLRDGFLVIEVHVTMIGVVKQKPLTVKVAPEAIHSVRYLRGAFRDKLVIRPFKANLLATVPGKHEGEITLRIKRAYRDEALDLVEDVKDWIERA